MKWVILATMILLAGCQNQFQSETVFLQRKGEKVQCGPYSAFTFSQEQEDRLRVCVTDYQKAGYERYQP